MNCNNALGVNSIAMNAILELVGGICYARQIIRYSDLEDKETCDESLRRYEECGLGVLDVLNNNMDAIREQVSKIDPAPNDD
ncbi:hypothetical protein [Pseudodesulfovibrio senegalensis]|uniref:Uncharacterized protein n=1 Tax=Pseudodesulfovibrio senegalensis TaxID=1721087 RepID=A0A6N6N5Q7_9BACT|nr:hypothetical protein [Pseudodesulfovibrio senegalensis]KAB1443081.1 hypothetical protein F8A88_02110 [Pseudodesulfovibrio senegalensis]